MKNFFQFKSAIGALCLAALAMLLLTAPSFGATRTWVPLTGGAWTTAANWGGTAPVAGDTVIIPAAQSANITAVPTISLNSLSVNGNCTFAAGASGNTLTIVDAFSVPAGITFTAGPSGARLEITLAATCVGTIAGTVSLDAGTGSTHTFTNSGTLTMGSAGVLSGGAGFTLSSGATLKIASTTGINGNITTTGTNTFNVGAHYVYNGTANQTNTGALLPTAITGSIDINNPGNTVTLGAAKAIGNGGTLNLIAGTFAAGTNLSMSTTSTIALSGGLMTGTPQGAGVYNVTYSGNSTTTGTELAGSGLNNITVGLNSGQTLTLDAVRAPDGNVTVSSGTLDLSSSTLNRSASGGTFTVSNGAGLRIGSTNPLPTNYTTLSFGASSSEEFYGGAQAVGAQTYGNLLLTNAGNKTLANTTTVAGGLTIASATLVAGANALNVAGNFTNNGGGFTSSGTVTLNGSSAQTIGGSTSTTFNNLTLGNTAGIDLGVNTTVSGTLNFSTSGNLRTSTNVLAAGSISNATNGKCVVGTLRKAFSTGSSTKSFEVGDATYESLISVTADVSSPGNLDVSAATGKETNLGSSSIDNAKYVNRYWTVNGSGGLALGAGGYSAVFNYQATDVQGGGDPTKFIVGKYSGGWTYPGVASRTSTSITTVSGLTSFSDFAIGEPGTHTITGTLHGSGSLSPSGAVTVNNAADQQFTFGPNTGYHLDSLIVDAVKNTDSTTSYTFKNVTGDHAIDVYFSVNHYTITVTNHGNGSVVPGTTTLDYNASQTFNIGPGPNNHIDSVVVDGTNLGAITSKDFNNVSASHTLDAYYSIDKYAITPSESGSGKINPNVPIDVTFGADQQFTYSPALGHHFDHIVVDGGPPITDSTTSYTFTNVTSTHTIVVYFATDQFTITPTLDGSGSMAPSGPQSVDYGADQQFTYSADGGWHIDSVLVDGIPTNDSTSSYTFKNVTAGHTIYVYTSVNKYTITVTDHGHGSVVPGTTTLAFNGSQTFAINADPNYHIDSVVADGTNLGVVTSHDFNFVTSAHTLDAYYSINQFTVTASAGLHGLVAPTAQTVDYGGNSAAINITPDPGYAIDTVYVNEVALPSPVATYTFNNVIGDSTLRAVFIALPYIVSEQTGKWFDPLTWNAHRVPNGTDSVIIAAGHIVTIDTTKVANGSALVINGTLAFAQVNAALTLLAGAHLGNVEVNGTGVIDFQDFNTEKITIPGNFSCVGTINNNSLGGGSLLVFNGAGTRSISSNVPLGTLKLNSASLVLEPATPLTVIYGVNLSAGKMKLGGNDLILDVDANIDPGSAASYIITDGAGRLVKYDVGALLFPFPVGTATSFNRVELMTQVGTDTFKVGVLDGVVPTSANDAAGVNKTFDVTRGGTTTIDSVTMTWLWAAADEGAAFNHAGCQSWRNDGGAWTEDGVVQKLDTISSGIYKATVFGITTFSHFTLGNPGALPVQMSQFTGAAIAAHTVKLDWSTTSEVNSYGFYVERRGAHTTAWTKVSDVIAGAGTSLQEHKYSWTDDKATDPMYYYRIRFIDMTSQVTFSSEIQVSTVLGVKDNEPLAFRLKQNYPNPFNPTTSIQYSIAQGGQVSLVVYNMLGQEVAHLVNGFQAAGRYNIQWNAGTMPSGQYFYRLISGANTQIMKMVLVK